MRQIENELSELTTRVFPKQEWPDTLWPMNEVRLMLARRYRDSGNYLQAVIYALKGGLGFIRRSGPDWDHTLFELIQFMTPVVVRERKEISTEHSRVPTDREFWDFFHGLLYQLLIQSKKTFGSDTAYTKAVVIWHAHAMNSAERPLPGETRFSKRFDRAQSTILSWAGIDMSRRIVLTE